MSKIVINSIHHVSFIVKDLAVSLAFYCDILKLEKKTNRPEMNFKGAWLVVNSSQEIHLLALNNPDPLEGRPEHGGRDRHAAFNIEKLAPLQELLDDNRIPYTMSKSGRPALFTRDPDSNALEFIES